MQAPRANLLTKACCKPGARFFDPGNVEVGQVDDDGGRALRVGGARARAHLQGVE